MLFFCSSDFDNQFSSSELLGSKHYNATGHIVGAQSILNIWYLIRNPNGKKEHAAGLPSFIEIVDDDIFELEQEFLQTSSILNDQAKTKGMQMLFANLIGYLNFLWHFN